MVKLVVYFSSINEMFGLMNGLTILQVAITAIFCIYNSIKMFSIYNIGFSVPEALGAYELN